MGTTAKGKNREGDEDDLLAQAKVTKEETPHTFLSSLFKSPKQSWVCHVDSLEGSIGQHFHNVSFEVVSRQIFLDCFCSRLHFIAGVCT